MRVILFFIILCLFAGCMDSIVYKEISPKKTSNQHLKNAYGLFLLNSAQSGSGGSTSEVTTFAGSGAESQIDGVGTAASFREPGEIAIDASGNLYVADNCKIRKITPSAEVTTFAGSDTCGESDGVGTSATFLIITDLKFDNSGNLVVLNAQVVRRVTPTGVVTTLLQFNSFPVTNLHLMSLWIDSSGNYFASDRANFGIWKWNNNSPSVFVGSGNQAFTNGTGTGASFNFSSGGQMVGDTSGNIFINDIYVIRKVTTAGEVTIFAGGDFGSVDATGTGASFGSLTGITIDSSGNLYTTDFTCKIRKITSLGVVTTVAGSGNCTTVDGIGTAASFTFPRSIAFDSTSGFLYVSEALTRKIRRIRL